MMSAVPGPTMPSLRPRAASSRISSIEVTGCRCLPRRLEEIFSLMITRGFSRKVSVWMPRATGTASRPEKVTPSVFGMISVNRSTASVNTIVKSHSVLSLNTFE